MTRVSSPAIVGSIYNKTCGRAQKVSTLPPLTNSGAEGGVTVRIRSLEARRLLSLPLLARAFLILGVTVPAKADPVPAAYIHAEVNDDGSTHTLPGGSMSSSTDSPHVERARTNVGYTAFSEGGMMPSIGFSCDATSYSAAASITSENYYWVMFTPRSGRRIAPDYGTTRNGSRQAKNSRIQASPTRDRLYTQWGNITKTGRDSHEKR